MEKRKRRWWLWFAGAVALAVVVLWFSSTYFRAVVWAVVDRDGTMLRVLLFSRGAEVSRPPSWASRTPLYKAALKGRADTVKVLLAKGANPNVKDDSSGETTQAAAVGRSPETVRALLAKGADPNVVTWQGHPLLTKAAGCAQPEVVRLLLDAGTDINARISSCGEYSRGTTALGAAFYYGEGAAWIADQCRLEDKPREAKRVEQFASRAAEVVKLLIERGADLHADDRYPSPLLRAVTWGRKDLVKFLLDKGEDVNRKDRTFTHKNGKREGGRTALQYAAAGGRVDLAELLLEAGADPNLADEEGTTPLMAAAKWKGNARVIRALLAKGARTDAKDKSGKTALDWAREKKREDIVGLLRGAPPTAP